MSSSSSASTTATTTAPANSITSTAQTPKSATDVSRAHATASRVASADRSEVHSAVAEKERTISGLQQVLRDRERASKELKEENTKLAARVLEAERKREADEAKKRAYIEKYIPQVAIGLQQILAFSDKDRDGVVAKLTDVLERSRKA